MAGNYLNNPAPQFLDGNGDPVASGTLEFWEAGATTTPLDTFTDSALTVANSNPIDLDADGRAPFSIFLQQLSYNVVLKDSLGSQIWARDDVSNITQISVAGTATVDTYAALTALLKASLLDGTFRQVNGRTSAGDIEPVIFQWDASSTATINSGTILQADEGGTGRWLMRFDGPFNVLWFDAKGDATTDDAAAFQAAATAASGDSLFIPAAEYKVPSVVDYASNTIVFGEGYGTFINASTNLGGITFRADLKSNVHFRDFRIEGDETTDDTTMIRIDGSTDCSVENVTAEIPDFGATPKNIACIGIKSSGATPSLRVKVSDCHISTPALGVILQTAGGGTSKDITIVDNHFTSVTTSALALGFTTGVVKIDLHGENVIVSNNTFDGNSQIRAAIQLEESIKNISIVGNVIRDCAEWGIRIFDGQGGLLVENASIAGNSLSGAGITIDSSFTTVFKNINISDNSIVDAPLAGISTEFVNLSTGVKIDGNVIDTTTLEGIITRAPNTIISNNIIRNTTNEGIILRDVSDFSSVIGNVLEECGVATTGFAARIRNSDNVIYSNNSHQNTKAVLREVLVSDNSLASTISGNIISTAGTTGIYVDTGSSGGIVSGNNVSGATSEQMGGTGLASMRVVDNIGHVTRNSGVTSVADAGTISHGLDGTPEAVLLTTTDGTHIAAVTALSATTFTVALKTNGGGSVGTPENVRWEAILAIAAT